MTSPNRFVLGILLLIVAPCVASAEGSVTLFAGRAFDGNMRETATFQAGPLDAYFASVAIGRKLAEWGTAAQWEAEGQVVKHFGIETHWEFAGALALRWHAFPWDRYLATSVAAGDGLSFATRTSTVEDQRHERTEKLLNYLFFELSVSAPGGSPWSLVLRQHHRSGVFGTFGGVRGGSDFLALGLRRAL